MSRYEGLNLKPEWIIIDEVQKIPQILDVVHQLIEKHQVKFALTGSSARKLKRAQANMLAGRAFNFSLFPLSFEEINDKFVLQDALRWGTLPKLFAGELVETIDKKRYLKSYVSTYLKEEIIVEQIIRKLEPFYRFLEVAAQSNGEILNYSKLAREASINDKNVRRYFVILSDTLMGVFIPSYHKSVRKQQVEAPRFYFFDTGVVRALRNHLNFDITPRTYDYGKLFKSFIIMEIYKLNQYYETDYQLYYLRTKESQEIDLIIEKPGGQTILIEIKSKAAHDLQDVKHLNRLLPAFDQAQAQAQGLVLCTNDEPVKLHDRISAVPWKQGIKDLFQS